MRRFRPPNGSHSGVAGCEQARSQQHHTGDAWRDRPSHRLRVPHSQAVRVPQSQAVRRAPIARAFPARRPLIPPPPHPATAAAAHDSTTSTQSGFTGAIRSNGPDLSAAVVRIEI